MNYQLHEDLSCHTLSPRRLLWITVMQTNRSEVEACAALASFFSGLSSDLDEVSVQDIKEANKRTSCIQASATIP